MLDTSMVAYLKNVISEFPETITGIAATPAVDQLFTIRTKIETQPLERKSRTWYFTTW